MALCEKWNLVNFKYEYFYPILHLFALNPISADAANSTSTLSLIIASVSLHVPIIAIPRAASEASGHGFYYLQGPAALLEMALVKFTVEKLLKKVCRRYLCRYTIFIMASFINS